MSQDYLIDIAEDGIATITLNRPDSLNALNDSMIYGLINELPALASNPAVGALVLTGAGRAFCSGGDVKGMKGNTSSLTYEDRVEALRSKHLLVTALAEFPKVTIAMVNGTAAGAGLGLALACDFRVASQSAKFLTSFVKVGFSGDFGGTYFLTRLLGAAKAKELYLTSDKVEADKALALGIVSRVTPDEELSAATREFARGFSQGARLAHSYIKRNFAAAPTSSLQEVLDMEAFYQIRLANSEDHTEAIKAFAEKRQPAFKGR